MCPCSTRAPSLPSVRSWQLWRHITSIAFARCARQFTRSSFSFCFYSFVFFVSLCFFRFLTPLSAAFWLLFCHQQYPCACNDVILCYFYYCCFFSLLFSHRPDIIVQFNLQSYMHFPGTFLSFQGLRFLLQVCMCVCIRSYFYNKIILELLRYRVKTNN